MKLCGIEAEKLLQSMRLQGETHMFVVTEKNNEHIRCISAKITIAEMQFESAVISDKTATLYAVMPYYRWFEKSIMPEFVVIRRIEQNVSEAAYTYSLYRECCNKTYDELFEQEKMAMQNEI